MSWYWGRDVKLGHATAAAAAAAAANNNNNNNNNNNKGSMGMGEVAPL
jgi:hypothetical protein